MRILVVAACPFPWPRGTPIRVLRLSEALVDRGHDLELVTYPLGDSAQRLPFPVYRTFDPGYYRKTSPGPSLTKLLVLNPALVRLTVRRLSEQGFDVIHAHHMEGLLVAIAARYLTGNPVPIVYDAHTSLKDELADYGPGLLNALKRSVGGWLDRVPPGKADHIVTVTEDLRARFLSRAVKGIEYVTMVSNGLEKDFFVHEDDKPEGDDTQAHPIIVFAGNLATYQGVGWLLKAFALLLHTKPHARLLMLTDDDFAPYRELCRQLGIEHAVSIERSPVDTLPYRLAQATVLVNPRVVCQGIPQKLLNYMASGRPIVSFAGSAKVVEEGVTARVVPDRDIAAFAEAMEQLINDGELARRLGSAARDRVGQDFSWETSARQIEAVFEGLVRP